MPSREQQVFQDRSARVEALRSAQLSVKDLEPFTERIREYLLSYGVKYEDVSEFVRGDREQLAMMIANVMLPHRDGIPFHADPHPFLEGLVRAAGIEKVDPVILGTRVRTERSPASRRDKMVLIPAGKGVTLALALHQASRRPHCARRAATVEDLAHFHKAHPDFVLQFPIVAPTIILPPDKVAMLRLQEDLTISLETLSHEAPLPDHARLAFISQPFAGG